MLKIEVDNLFKLTNVIAVLEIDIYLICESLDAIDLYTLIDLAENE